jgi:hypothetical protein
MPDNAWWKSKGGIATATALISLAGTWLTAVFSLGTAYVEQRAESARKQSELKLAEQKYDYDLEKQYFDQAIDPNHSLDIRSSTLRFLTKSARVSPEMKIWAAAELDALAKSATEQKASLEKAKEHLTTQIAATGGKLEDGKPEQRAALLDQQRDQLADLMQLQNKLTASTRALEQAQAVAVGRSCAIGKIVAVALGPDDPSQDSADAYCRASAAGQLFSGAGGSTTTWPIRRETRTFSCRCELQ